MAPHELQSDIAGLAAAMELADESVVITDADLDSPGPRIRYVNAAFERLTGYPRQEVIGHSPRFLQGAATERAVLERLRARLEAGQPFEGNCINYRRDGTPFVMEWRVRAFHDEQGVLRGYVSVQRAVEDQPPSGGVRAGGDSLHRQIFDQHELPMLLLDPADGRIVDANRGAVRFYGYPADRLRRMTVTELNELTPGETQAELRRVQSERTSRLVFRHRLANGERRPVEVYSSPITLVGREYLHSVVHDVSERDQLAEEVQRRLYYDPVTELPNRGLFRERLEQALRIAGGEHRTAVLRLDIDRFRQLNQLLGHHRADTALCRVAERLQARLRRVDTLARTGSDEFSLVIPEVGGAADVARLAERLCAAVREPLTVDGRTLHLTASVATAVAPQDGHNMAMLTARTDATMGRIKRENGDGWAAHDADRSRRDHDQIRLAEDLREALGRDRLSVAWQPTIRLADGSPAGGEMLVRWQHHVDGWIRPDHFVAAAEASGQIAELGDWVLRRAMRAAMHSCERYPAPLAVNVSLHQLRSPDFVDGVLAAVGATGFPAASLELELTESAFADESPALIERLQALRNAGVSIAIDDFGTGFSSLQYLRRLPIDRLKIDRSFVTGVQDDRDNQAIVAAIVALAERFGLALTAEGIEHAAERDTLLSLGVTIGQGYLFGRPRLVEPLPAATVAHS